MKVRALCTVCMLLWVAVIPISAERVPIISSTLLQLHATVTAYSSTRRETSRHPTITASGKHVAQGTIACPRRFPFGTKVSIAGKTYRCEDRLNRRFDERFDIWKENSAAARSFGKRRLPVIVTEIPPSAAVEGSDLQ